MDEPKPPATLTPVPGPRRSAGGDVAMFCDGCGYALNGLPMVKCPHCDVLQFTCPECGHHQPINSHGLAMQRMSGWLRLGLVIGVILIKLNVFGWCLFIFFLMGDEVSRVQADEYQYQRMTLGMEEDVALGSMLYALAFGMVGRMLLLRWRSTIAVAFALATVVALADVLGRLFREWDRTGDQHIFDSSLPMFVWWCFTWVAVGAAIAWPIWVAVVRMLMPARAAKALLEWQDGLSKRGEKAPAA